MKIGITVSYSELIKVYSILKWQKRGKRKKTLKRLGNKKTNKLDNNNKFQFLRAAKNYIRQFKNQSVEISEFVKIQNSGLVRKGSTESFEPINFEEG